MRALTLRTDELNKDLAQCEALVGARVEFHLSCEIVACAEDVGGEFELYSDFGVRCERVHDLDSARSGHRRQHSEMDEFNLITL
jgi:hypothetical protein